MATNTTNYKLIKPAATDPYNIADQNNNMDIIDGALTAKADAERTVNGKPLSADVTLGAADVGAVPVTRRVNGKALSADVTLATADISGLATALAAKVDKTLTVNGKPLSADVTLAAADISGLATELAGKAALSHTHDERYYTESEADTLLGAKVNKTLTVNGKALSGNITLAAADVGAVPVTRKVNGKALAADITLAAADVGAHPVSWTPTAAEVGAAKVDLSNVPAATIKTAVENSGFVGGAANVLDGSAVGSVRTSGSAAESAAYAIGEYAFTEGYNTKASGGYSHAEGCNTSADSYYTHAEGEDTRAYGNHSHVEGLGTQSQDSHQHIQGRYNDVSDSLGKAHVVGNGWGDTSRSNAHTLDWSGNAWFAGKVTAEGEPVADTDLTTKAYVDGAIAVSESGTSTLLAAKVAKTGGTMTGVLKAQTNTSYTTAQVRNIALQTAVPTSISNGALVGVYE